LEHHVAATRGDLVGGVLALGLVDVGEGNLGAVPAQEHRGRLAEAHGPSRDQGDLTVYPSHVACLRFVRFETS
jgi:hypothetical protein